MRIFLGWDRPAIVAVAELLMQNYRQGSWLDLSRVAVVFPGSRAGRRFLQVLLQTAGEIPLRILPPKIVTTGSLPELLYDTDRRLAPTWAQEWGWAAALTRLTRPAQALMLGHSTENTDFSRWQLARRIQRCYQELAADGWRPADVARRWPRKSTAEARQWWQTLVKWETHYLQVLAENEFADRHDLRLSAIRDGLCRCHLDLLIVGAADLRRQVRQMLECVPERVTACVVAPPSWDDDFDDMGCLVPARWADRPMGLSDAQWSVARGPADVASVVADAVAERWNASFPGGVTLAVTDDALVPNLQRASQQRGATARWATGQPFSQTSAWRLLQLLRSWLANDNDPTAGIDLLRHPDVADWLVRKGAPTNWLQRWDHRTERVVPLNLADLLVDPHLSACRDAMESWRDLWAAPRPLPEWSQAIGQWIAGLLEGVVLRSDHPEEGRRLAAWDQLAARLQEWSGGPPGLAPNLTAVQALEWLLRQMERESIPPEADADAWEMLGWLELLLDDAPHVVVAGFSEATIPGPTSPDVAWPVPLPEPWQVPDDRLRFARDAYVLQTILSARTSCHIVVGRVDGVEAPLLPSRLLFQNTPAIIANRWKRVLHDVREEDSRAITDNERGTSARRGFTVPRLDAYLQPMTTIRVTDFAAYLACPYRFYLRRILNLHPVAHEVYELSPTDFGTLAHNVLAEFGRGPLKDADDPRAIEAALQKLLRIAVQQQYGSRPRAAVQLQVSQLQLRFSRFAVEQAKCRREGWRILHVEHPLDHPPIPWVVDEEPIGLIGRIDRIDRHEDGERLRILDYKTSEQSKSPRAQHGPDKNGAWKDLQLPMYLPIARGLQLQGPIELGYFPLGKSKAATRVRLADWSEDEFDTAARAAQQVIRDMRAQTFWPPVYPPPPFAETLAAICLDNVRERDLTLA